MDAVAIAEAVTTILEEVIKAAPVIEKGIADIEPYVQAMVGLIEGTNVTQDQLDAAVANVQALSQQFQQPLPDQA